MNSSAGLVETGTPSMAGALLGRNAFFRKSEPEETLLHCVPFTEVSKTSVATKRNVPLWEVSQDCLCWAEGLACLLAQVGLWRSPLFFFSYRNRHPDEMAKIRWRHLNTGSALLI